MCGAGFLSLRRCAKQRRAKNIRQRCNVSVEFTVKRLGTTDDLRFSRFCPPRTPWRKQNRKADKVGKNVDVIPKGFVADGKNVEVDYR